MKIKQLHLQNFCRFEDLIIPLVDENEKPSPVTVFIGENGAGKTSILQALALSLSWLTARISREKGSGSPISDTEILNGKAFTAISLCLEHAGNNFSWKLVKARKGRKKSVESELVDVTRLAEHFRYGLTDNDSISLPMVVYYPVERVVLDVPLKIRTRHSFEQLDGYDNSLKQGIDFRRFFEWFREREDAENEAGFSEKIFQNITSILAQHSVTDEIWKKLEELKVSPRDRQLIAVRTAISTFMPGFSNLRVKRRPRLQMLIDKSGETLNVVQLSQGEKSLMALVGDMARRLAMMNPSLKNPLQGEGVVLIDEVDMHLHPRWARSIINNLCNTFPNCQFILTTHSPLVISDSKNMIGYILNQEGLRSLGNLYGMDVNQVLLQEMGAEIRSREIQDRLDNLFDAIQDGKCQLARELLQELEQVLPADHLEISKAHLLLKRAEARRA